MKKYKIKRKTTYSISTIFLLIVIVTSLTGIGYSMFATTLVINGKANLGAEGEENILENILQPITVGGNDYTNVTAQENFFAIQSQQLSNNTLIVNLKKQDSKGKARDLQLNFNLKNVGKYNYINGNFNAQVTSGTGFISTNPTISSGATILVGETGILSVNFAKLKNNKLSQSSCTITIQYEINNTIEEYYIIINFS